jgi:hypothetical protein
MIGPIILMILVVAGLIFAFIRRKKNTLKPITQQQLDIGINRKLLMDEIILLNKQFSETGDLTLLQHISKLNDKLKMLD